MKARKTSAGTKTVRHSLQQTVVLDDNSDILGKNLLSVAATTTDISTNNDLPNGLGTSYSSDAINGYPAVGNGTVNGAQPSYMNQMQRSHEIQQHYWQQNMRNTGFVAMNGLQRPFVNGVVSAYSPPVGFSNGLKNVQVYGFYPQHMNGCGATGMNPGASVMLMNAPPYSSNHSMSASIISSIPNTSALLDPSHSGFPNVTFETRNEMKFNQNCNVQGLNSRANVAAIAQSVPSPQARGHAAAHPLSTITSHDANGADAYRLPFHQSLHQASNGITSVNVQNYAHQQQLMALAAVYYQQNLASTTQANFNQYAFSNYYAQMLALQGFPPAHNSVLNGVSSTLLPTNQGGP